MVPSSLTSSYAFFIVLYGFVFEPIPVSSFPLLDTYRFGLVISIPPTIACIYSSVMFISALPISGVPLKSGLYSIFTIISVLSPLYSLSFLSPICRQAHILRRRHRPYPLSHRCPLPRFPPCLPVRSSM